jgi:hypothetical protein
MPPPRVWIPLSALLAHLVLGLAIVGDYGVSWDEPYERLHALVSARYLSEKLSLPHAADVEYRLGEYHDRYHGVFFTLGAYGLERIFGAESFRDIYLLRHHWTFLLFWLGMIAFYFLARRYLGDWRWALLAWAMLLLSPRIFADSFYNPKDIPLLSLYVFSAFTMLLYFEKRGLGYAVLHAFACGMAISMRVVALIVPALTLCFVLLELAQARFERRLLWAHALRALVFLSLSLGFSIAFWPYLWDQPFYRLGQAFQQMSQFHWPGRTLFRGVFFAPKETPWYYAPYWIFISTPLWYSFLLGVALRYIATHTFKAWRSARRLYLDRLGRADWVLLALWAGPLAAVIVFGAVLYDGWRHLYFTYPLLVLLAAGGLRRWVAELRRRRDRSPEARFTLRVAIALAAFSLLYHAHFLVKYHPHQQVYFNALTFGDKLGQLELDYWGLSYRQGFEALGRLDARDTIRVAVQSDPGRFNWQFLPDTLQRRFLIVDQPGQADYYLTHFRLWEDGFQAYREKAPPFDGPEVFSARVGANKIMAAYRTAGAPAPRE